MSSLQRTFAPVRALRAVALLGVCGVLAGCETTSSLSSSAGPTNTLVTAPNRPGPTIDGLLPALDSSPLGREMDADDRAMADAATQKALQVTASGTVVPWTNPETGHSGSTTPEPPFRQEGKICRRFSQTIEKAGRALRARGVGCLGEKRWDTRA